MDKLSDLPTQDTELTPEENSVMKNMFDGGQAKKSPKGWIHTIKLAGISAALFILLANPWIDAILCKLPYCEDNSMIILAIKGLLFLIIWILMYKYLM
ncbi:MAG TPA: hypothetical protein PKD85_01095 [Saprospiraceae bacterium]|nr:hypothetical protein [Saprospiraceae bacterium]